MIHRALAVAAWVVAMSTGLVCPRALGQDAPTGTPPSVPGTPDKDAQDGPTKDGQAPAKDPPGDGSAKQPLRVEDLPPQVRLGIRSELLRRQLGVLPTVVVVRDERSYVIAISEWSLDKGHFPVLIDDGTPQARLQIARFVRAFEPAKVVRWDAPAANAWPADKAGRQTLVEAALSSAWGAQGPGRTLERYKQLNHTPPGVIAASMDDPAWTAALALAAGRGQLIAWIDAPPIGGGASGAMSLVQAGQLSEDIARFCRDAGLGYDQLGDAVDAVTLCMATPVKAVVPSTSPPLGRAPFVCKPGEAVATTDIVGRKVGAGEYMERWAWCGQIFGTASSAANDAMCALFIQPRAAWLFDGYENTGVWNAFDCTAAGAMLTKGGFATSVADVPRQGSEEWRVLSAGAWRTLGGTKKPKGAGAEGPGGAGEVGGVSAGLICVNTSGMSESFDLRPGQCVGGDIPMLNLPTIVHFVHSWSAQQPGNTATVAGRWLERGAYAYIGSVHEPFLTAFQPTPDFVKRMLAPAPLGAAARIDGMGPWRIAVIGDPLITFGVPAPRLDSPLPLTGAVDTAVLIAEALKAGKFGEAVENLLIAGRDADALRLTRAMLRDQKEQVTQEVALAVLPVAFMKADLETFTDLADLTSPRVNDVESVGHGPGDMLWQALGAAGGPQGTLLSQRQMVLLMSFPRRESTLRDAEEIARVVRKVEGQASAQRYLRSLAAKQKNESLRKSLEAMAEK